MNNAPMDKDKGVGLNVEDEGWVGQGRVMGGKRGQTVIEKKFLKYNKVKKIKQ